MNNRMIVIAGPTAVGKSAAAVRLAKKLNTEIVSADSMQVYKGMDIGTAKITESEMDGVRHHLTDCMDPHENYDVVRFKEMAEEACRDIQERGMIPIVCGGTGFYIQALLYDIDFTEEEGLPEYREELFMYAARNGNEALHRLLSDTDPSAALKIPLNNVKRTVRALEFFRIHNKLISEHNAAEEKKKEKAAYDSRLFVLYDEREKLYERINMRVDRMMERGFLSEVEALIKSGVDPKGTAMQAIGYKQLYEYLSGKCSYEEAVENIKTISRRYAKKQLTWFRREKDAIWVNAGEGDTVNEILGHLW